MRIAAASGRYWSPGTHRCVVGVGSYRAATYDCLGRSSGSPASAGWPAANRAILVPIEIDGPVIVKQVWWLNGATVTGAVDVGLLDITGQTLLGHIGSTGQSGSSALQVADITDLPLAPGVYYMAMSMDSTSTITRCSTPSTQWMTVCGVQQAGSAFPLAGSLTLANPAAAYIPLFGVTLQGAF